MTTPRSTRKSLPTTGALSLTSPHAEADLRWLGWWNEQSVEVLWALAGAADANLALNTLIRLMQSLEESGQGRSKLDQAIRSNPVLRVRLFALLGGSSVLGDHVVANPETWELLLIDAPTRREMFQELLGCISAVPAHFSLEIAYESCRGDTASDDLDCPGTYLRRSFYRISPSFFQALLFSFPFANLSYR